MLRTSVKLHVLSFGHELYLQHVNSCELFGAARVLQDPSIRDTKHDKKWRALQILCWEYLNAKYESLEIISFREHDMKEVRQSAIARFYSNGGMDDLFIVL